MVDWPLDQYTATDPAEHAGWLTRDDRLEYQVGDVAFRTTDPTRREEYHWAAGVAERYTTGDWGRFVALDAGCGFDPTIHLFPYMMAPYYRLVLAVDNDARHLKMPHAPGIFRMMGDITTPTGMTECVDIYTCISVLEHLGAPEREGAFRGAFDLLKSGGLLVATADDIPPATLNQWAEVSGFEVGPVLPGDSDLSPKISYLVARKP